MTRLDEELSDRIMAASWTDDWDELAMWCHHQQISLCADSRATNFDLIKRLRFVRDIAGTFEALKGME